MKGSVFDIVFIPIILVVVGIVFILGGIFITQLQASSLGTQLSDAGITWFEDTDEELESFDQASLILLIGLIAGSSIMAFFIRSHPIFVIITILLYLVFVFMAVFISNTFEAIATSSPLAIAAANELPIYTQIMLNLPALLIIGTIIIGISAYAGLRRDTNAGWG